MTVNIDDDLLVRTVNFDAFVACPLGMSEAKLRFLRNQLIGNPHRKKQFMLGSGLSELLSIAKTSCLEGKENLLSHILTMIASMASSKEAALRLLGFEVIQIINFVIRSTKLPHRITLQALKILRCIMVLRQSMELPLPELFQLAHSDSEAIAELSFSIFSQCSASQIGAYLWQLSSLCFVRLRQSKNVVAYLEFFHFILQSGYQWNSEELPMASFLRLIEHEDPNVQLKSIQCIAEIPPTFKYHIPDLSRALQKCLRVLIASLGDKSRQCYFDDYCRALTKLLKHHPSFIPETKLVIPILLSNISISSLDALTEISANSEAFRVQVISSLDLASIKTRYLRHDSDICLSVANLFRILSRCLKPSRMKLFKIGILEALFKELASTYWSHGNQMSDADTSNGFHSVKPSDNHFAYAIALTGAIANLLIDFNSLPRPDISSDRLALLVKGTKSACASLREVSCLSLRNFCFNATYSSITELICWISISDILALLKDPAESLQIQAIGLLRNIIVPESNRIIDFMDMSNLVFQAGTLLGSQNPMVVLEALSTLVNIAAGFRDRKITLLCNEHILESVRRLFDHSWPEICLKSIIFFENLFCRAYMFKKKRMVANVPVDRLIALGFKESLSKVQEKEKARGNHDAEARAARAARGVEKCLRVLMAVLQTP